jgi:AraC-like DNA-binding protein
MTARNRAAENLGSVESVTAAARAVDYADPNKFSAAFRRVTGVLPSEFSRADALPLDAGAGTCGPYAPISLFQTGSDFALQFGIVT